jgi:hypothetical protein
VHAAAEGEARRLGLGDPAVESVRLIAYKPPKPSCVSNGEHTDGCIVGRKGLQARFIAGAGAVRYYLCTLKAAVDMNGLQVLEDPGDGVERGVARQDDLRVQEEAEAALERHGPSARPRAREARSSDPRRAEARPADGLELCLRRPRCCCSASARRAAAPSPSTAPKSASLAPEEKKPPPQT